MKGANIAEIGTWLALFEEKPVEASQSETVPDKTGRA